MALAVNRASSEKALRKACKRVALKAYLDKGGTNENAKTFQAAREKCSAFIMIFTLRGLLGGDGQTQAEWLLFGLLGSTYQLRLFRHRFLVPVC